MTRIAVIGAGPAGLLAARRLQDAGQDVTVFDKGRRPGGRTNTREHGEHVFDHGAQFFTVRDARIQRLLKGWIDRGVVGLWKGRLVRISKDGVRPANVQPRYVGIPGMISLAKHLADGLDVRTGVRVRTVERTVSTWELRDEEHVDLGGYDQVIVTVPAPQATLLLKDAPRLQHITEQVFMAPAWAGLFVFESKPPLDFDGAFLADSDFTWVARNASKPGRPGLEAWVVHMSAEWTRLHWTVDRAGVPSRILSSLTARFGQLPPTVFERAHRWGFSRLVGPPTGVLYDADLGIGVAGDWTVGGRVEGALVSGLDVADRALDRLGVGAHSPAPPVVLGTIR